MTNISLAYLQANSSELIPHIEERAIEISHRQTPVLQRCLIFDNMVGWADRKVSSYLDTDDAEELSENVAIPISNIYRRRLATSTPKEWGSAYDITDRRISTDPSGIISNAINALGIGLRRRIENQLFQSAIDGFIGNRAGRTTFNVTLGDLLSFVTYANHVSRSPGAFTFVFHPYQVYNLLKSLLELSTATNAQEAGAASNNLSSLPDMTTTFFRLPNLGDITISGNIPRRVTYRIYVYGASGTFRLQIGRGNAIVPATPVSGTKYNITAEIAVTGLSTTTLATALTNLGYGTWTVAGTVGSANGLKLTPPASLSFNDRDQLRPAIKVDAADDITLDSSDPIMYAERSKYDKVAGTIPTALATKASTAKDINGTVVGFEMEESNAEAYGIAFKRNALLFDPRSDPTLFSEFTKDGRVMHLSYYQTFGTTAWEARDGFVYASIASSPL